MTAVTIAPTFGKNERPSNGLEAICASLIKDQLGRHFVVGVVQFAGSSRPGPNEPEIPRVKFLAIEPLVGDAAEQVSQILDQAREQRGLGLVDADRYGRLARRWLIVALAAQAVAVLALIIGAASR